jgi:hypothetical protein
MARVNGTTKAVPGTSAQAPAEPSLDTQPAKLSCPAGAAPKWVTLSEATAET